MAMLGEGELLLDSDVEHQTGNGKRKTAIFAAAAAAAMIGFAAVAWCSQSEKLALASPAKLVELFDPTKPCYTGYRNAYQAWKVNGDDSWTDLMSTVKKCDLVDECQGITCTSIDRTKCQMRKTHEIYPSPTKEVTWRKEPCTTTTSTPTPQVQSAGPCYVGYKNMYQNVYADDDSSHTDLQTAKKKCDASERCKGVTCNSAQTSCSIRASGTLKHSWENQITWRKESASHCETTTPPAPSKELAQAGPTNPPAKPCYVGYKNRYQNVCADDDCSHTDLQTAKKKCDASERCKGVTCNSAQTSCSIRASGTLKQSWENQITWRKESASHCETTTERRLATISQRQRRMGTGSIGEMINADEKIQPAYKSGYGYASNPTGFGAAKAPYEKREVLV